MIIVFLNNALPPAKQRSTGYRPSKKHPGLFRNSSRHTASMAQRCSDSYANSFKPSADCSLLFSNKTSSAVSKKLPKSKTINEEAPFLE